MRDIKFRAFINSDATGDDAGLMHYPNDNSDFELFTNGSSCFSMVYDYERWVDEDKFNVMQFTGLTDKNGTEIYEGDLIEVVRNKNCALLVEFINDYVGGWILSHPSSNGHISLGARNSLEIEVVGNIYENPELLEDES